MWYKIIFWIFTAIGAFLVVVVGTSEYTESIGIYAVISGNLLILAALLIAFYGSNHSHAFDHKKKK